MVAPTEEVGKATSKTDEASREFEPAGKSREWNFHPALPISMSPVFDIPPRPKAALNWLFGIWLKLTLPVSHLAFALVAFAFFWLSTKTMQTLTWGWPLQIFAINFSATLILVLSQSFC